MLLGGHGHILGGEGVSVHNCVVVVAQQRSAAALSPGETVVGFAFRLHSESAILRSAFRSAADIGFGRRLRTVSGSILLERGGFGFMRAVGSSLKLAPGRVQKSAIAAAISSDLVCFARTALRLRLIMLRLLIDGLVPALYPLLRQPSGLAPG